MAREDLHFRLRIPEDLKNWIEEAADNNRRSMTAEIIARLDETFTTWPRVRLPDALVMRIKQALEPEELAVLEANLSNSIKERLMELFPYKSQPEIVRESVEALIQNASNEDKDELKRDLDALMAKLMVSIDKEVPF